MKIPLMVQCAICKEEIKVMIDYERYQQWKSGALIQNAMPELTIAERELLVSGTCGKCFDNLFKEQA